MRQINFGMTLSLLLVTALLISGCSNFRPEKEVVTVTKLVERTIPTVSHPKTVQMNDIKIYVVSPSENYEQFVEEFSKKMVLTRLLQSPSRTMKICRKTLQS